MCLITEQKKPIILKVDLVVYKILKRGNMGVYWSTCHRKAWVQGVISMVAMRHRKFNSRDSFCDNVDMYYYYNKEALYTVSRGFHAFLSTKRIGAGYWDLNVQMEGKGEIKEMLIPKGSEVYYDATGLVVSNQMILL